MSLRERGLEHFLVGIRHSVVIRSSVNNGPVFSVLVDRIAQIALIVVEPFCNAVSQGVIVHAEGFDTGAVHILLGQDSFFQLSQDASLVRDEFGQADRLVPREVVGIGDGHLVFHRGTILAGDKDDAPGCTATINGSRCRILQHGNALDVIRVHE